MEIGQNLLVIFCSNHPIARLPNYDPYPDAIRWQVTVHDELQFVMHSDLPTDMRAQIMGWVPYKQGGPENPKARQRTARLFLKMLWCGQLCSGRYRCKIFAETSCALMVSRATIHHSMLCQLRLHSSSRYCC